jgi:nucleotide sugar dehydrogenase
MAHKVGVVGVGFVGTAVSTGLEAVLGEDIEIREYDKFKDSESLDSVVNNSDIVFICLPTPMNEDGSCNTSIVEDGVADVALVARKSKIIVVKSTVPPGTTYNLAKAHPKHNFVFNPEFLREKFFIEDFINQDRIILGYGSKASGSKFAALSNMYVAFAKKQTTPATIVWCNSTEAEMLKYVTNCFLATKVAFFNEIYAICDGIGADYQEVVRMLKYDKRIGNTHMAVPGPDGKHGFGGSCFPKDLNALMAFADKFGFDTTVMESVWAKNLLVREECEWEDLAQVNGKYEKK